MHLNHINNHCNHHVSYIYILMINVYNKYNGKWESEYIGDVIQWLINTEAK